MLFMISFRAVFSLGIIGLLGFYLKKSKKLTDSASSSLSLLSIDIALPCLVFLYKNKG